MITFWPTVENRNGPIRGWRLGCEEERREKKFNPKRAKLRRENLFPRTPRHSGNLSIVLNSNDLDHSPIIVKELRRVDFIEAMNGIPHCTRKVLIPKWALKQDPQVPAKYPSRVCYNITMYTANINYNTTMYLVSKRNGLLNDPATALKLRFDLYLKEASPSQLHLLLFSFFLSSLYTLPTSFCHPTLSSWRFLLLLRLLMSLMSSLSACMLPLILVCPSLTPSLSSATPQNRY